MDCGDGAAIGPEIIAGAEGVIGNGRGPVIYRTRTKRNGASWIVEARDARGGIGLRLCQGHSR